MFNAAYCDEYGIPYLSQDIIRQPHCLIAGATGSGKSVLLNSIVYTLIQNDKNKMLLIDPKRVELVQYAGLPQTMGYASEPESIAQWLNYALWLMEERYKTMQRARQKLTSEPPIYIIIDEFADLMTTQRKTVLPTLCRIAQLGRAAKIHLILATQRPTRDIVNGQIKVNIDCRVALRCPTAQDSRNIIGVKGAEMLPKIGYGLYLTPDTMQPIPVKIPFVPENEIQNSMNKWRN